MARTYNGRFHVPEEPKVGTGWLIAGLVMIPTWPSFFTLVASIGCFIKYGKQVREHRLYERFHDYCAVIGMRGRVSVKELKNASPSGTGMGDVRRNLQQMISRGYFGDEAYIDLARNELVLSNARRSGGAQSAEAPREEGGRGWLDMLFDVLNALRLENVFQGEVHEDDFAYRARPGDYDYREVSYEANSSKPQAKAQPQTDAQPQAEPTKPKPAPKPAKRTYAEELERTLNELYQLNVQIEDEAVSHRIDRIGTLTAGIFRAVIEKPEREQDVRKFMNYYLPTTLKLLRSYDMLEEQSYQSESIVQSRRKIEEILDTLIAAYEKLLDRLFRNDALDIATDIDVLEMMMAQDGLSMNGGAAQGLKL